MKRSRLLYSLAIVVLIFGCGQNKPDDKEVEKTKQNLQSNYVMKYTDSTMQVYAEKAYSVLVDHNYKFPSAIDFERTINDVYHVDIKKPEFDDIDLSDENGPVPMAIRQKNFIYVFDPISDKEPIVDKTLTFNLNNYLFNKNTGSRNLLLNSKNKGYLFGLVEKYGYADDEYLLKYVLDEKYKNYDSFEKLGAIIFIKKPDGSLEIRTKILDYIAANANEHDVVLARNILLYCFKLVEENEKSEFSAAQKVKIIAFAANSIDPVYKKYHRIYDQHWGTGSILAHYLQNASGQNWEDAKATYLKEKYYGLKNLKEMIAYAEEFDEIGAPD